MKTILLTGAAIVVGTAAFLLVRKPEAPRVPAELAALSDAELVQVDIARMNMICAQGLPGADNLDVEASLQLLDEWADLVVENEPKYRRTIRQDPGRYDNSLAKFRAVNLGLTLKQDLKCGYNQDLVQQGLMSDVKSTRFFQNSGDLFLHGFAENKRGSCSSLPVLMVAVGRRCGYPLYLVACKGHLFCRWDDGNERFNIETACPGIDSKPDEYYRSWPHPATDEEIRSEKYLKNLPPREELGVFCQIRAACLQENGRFAEAAEAYRLALIAFPDSKQLKLYLNHVERKAAEQERVGLQNHGRPRAQRWIIPGGNNEVVQIVYIRVNWRHCHSLRSLLRIRGASAFGGRGS